MAIEIEMPESFIDDFADTRHIGAILQRIAPQRALIAKAAEQTDDQDQASQLPPRLVQGIEAAQQWLLQQRVSPHAYWYGEVEAHVGLNAQYILLSQGLGIAEPEQLRKLYAFILSRQNQEGLWPIYYQGPANLGATLLAYLAGRSLGYAADGPQLGRAREFIRAQGGPEAANSECQFLMALYGLFPWEAVTAISPLLALLPDDAEFSIYATAYWIRISLMPMSILYAKRYRLRIPGLDSIAELRQDPGQEGRVPHAPYRRKWKELLEKQLPEAFSLPLPVLERVALKKVEQWLLAHQDASGDWGGIYPPMQYGVLALHALGYSLEHPAVAGGLAAMQRFQVQTREYIHQQSCVSPVWDTGWALLALDSSGYDMRAPAAVQAADWLISKQILVPGDWALRNKTGLAGGWAFQLANDYFPDTDDSAVVMMALLKTPHTHSPADLEALLLGVRWLLTMQNPDGGWSAFEQGVDDEYVKTIPLNDMDNWLDPSTADVTGRCLQLLGYLGCTTNQRPVAKAVRFLAQSQEENGAWFGRWGVNYIYGTWSVLMGLSAIGVPANDSLITRACDWLINCQQADGGWGESCASYDEPSLAGQGVVTASQTAWAVAALIAAGRGQHSSVTRGIQWLLDHQDSQGTWEEAYFTGTGFPGHFYLRYDLYRHYFPLLALGAYRQYLLGV